MQNSGSANFLGCAPQNSAFFVFGLFLEAVLHSASTSLRYILERLCYILERLCLMLGAKKWREASTLAGLLKPPAGPSLSQRGAPPPGVSGRVRHPAHQQSPPGGSTLLLSAPRPTFTHTDGETHPSTQVHMQRQSRAQMHKHLPSRTHTGRDAHTLGEMHTTHTHRITHFCTNIQTIRTVRQKATWEWSQTNTHPHTLITYIHTNTNTNACIRTDLSFSALPHRVNTDRMVIFTRFRDEEENKEVLLSTASRHKPPMSLSLSLSLSPTLVLRACLLTWAGAPHVSSPKPCHSSQHVGEDTHKPSSHPHASSTCGRRGSNERVMWQGPGRGWGPRQTVGVWLWNWIVRLLPQCIRAGKRKWECWDWLFSPPSSAIGSPVSRHAGLNDAWLAEEASHIICAQRLSTQPAVFLLEADAILTLQDSRVYSREPPVPPALVLHHVDQPWGRTLLISH